MAIIENLQVDNVGLGAENWLEGLFEGSFLPQVTQIACRLPYQDVSSVIGLPSSW